jgi:hypothetical protein
MRPIRSYLERIPSLFCRGPMQPQHPDTAQAVEEFYSQLSGKRKEVQHTRLPYVDQISGLQDFYRARFVGNECKVERKWKGLLLPRFLVRVRSYIVEPFTRL